VNFIPAHSNVTSKVGLILAGPPCTYILRIWFENAYSRRSQLVSWGIWAQSHWVTDP